MASIDSIQDNWEQTKHARILTAVHRVEQDRLSVYPISEGWTVQQGLGFTAPTWLEAVERYYALSGPEAASVGR